ncbi:hypothetical protein BpHYR1_035602 [Brachionus plicatilis]|uniref:Uncharacterized protein n=1 Tax=Brachionus plicatilis TaxID=10195 RepID=A0A3M7R2U6_BRAPC|nr:hypothetical protein BpHYR1_035602 [Brachionus plicatilis]
MSSILHSVKYYQLAKRMRSYYCTVKLQSSLDNTMCLGGKNGHRINQYRIIKNIYQFYFEKTDRRYKIDPF